MLLQFKMFFEVLDTIRLQQKTYKSIIENIPDSIREISSILKNLIEITTKNPNYQQYQETINYYTI